MFNPTQLRSERQSKLNAQLASDLFHGNVDATLINNKALKRLLEFKNMTKVELFADCYYNKSLADAVAFAIVKNATRQGIKDEALVLDYINSHSLHEVTNLSVNAKRYDRIDKSVDGVFSGKYKGDIFAKVIVGRGGHQDNVWLELKSIAQIARNLDNKRIYCLLVDTDDIPNFNKLKTLETNNVWVCDTQELINRLS
jgi:hypothetical protein